MFSRKKMELVTDETFSIHTNEFRLSIWMLRGYIPVVLVRNTREQDADVTTLAGRIANKVYREYLGFPCHGFSLYLASFDQGLRYCHMEFTGPNAYRKYVTRVSSQYEPWRALEDVIGRKIDPVIRLDG